jgi:hypothetical protein
MAIYDFSNAEKGELKTSALPQRRLAEEEGASTESEINETLQPRRNKRDQIFSALATRLFFLLLVVADLLWVGYSLALLIFSAAGFSLTGGRVVYFKNLNEKAWVTLRRSLVCGVSLLIALFSPAFGIMIACTYFLMYDKTGIEEVVPSSLQSQFKEFLPKE